MIRFGYLLALLAAGLLLPGCSSYQLGTGSTPKFQTLYIAPVRSFELIPQAMVLVTTQLREAFSNDGRLKVVDSADAADVQLQVTLTGLNRQVAVSKESDTGLARRYDVTLDAVATLTDNRTRQNLFERRPLAAKRGVFTDDGQVPAEYQMVPLLAELLAQEAAHAVLDTW